MGWVLLRQYWIKMRRLAEIVLAEKEAVSLTQLGDLTKGSGSEPAKAETGSGSKCKTWRTPSGGLEHEPHVNLDVRSSSFFSDHGTTELSCAGRSHHCHNKEVIGRLYGSG